MIVHVDRLEGVLAMAYKKGVRQAGNVLIDQRGNGSFSLEGFDDFIEELGELSRADFGERMLKAAEPHLIRAMDSQMLRHPGTLQKSLKSTGAKKNDKGGWYLAYRPTTGNEKPKDKSNYEKMIYLINREWVGEPGGPGYAIPADDVVDKAVIMSEDLVYDALSWQFDEILEEIEGDG